MSKERTLANIAQTAYWTVSENQDTFDRVAKAVEKEVLARLNKSEAEPVAGQVLSIVQVAQWIEKHGSTRGLQRQDGILKWLDDDVKSIYSGLDYRVAPKKVNDPDDPTTWESGIKFFRKTYRESSWDLGIFESYDKEKILPYACNGYRWRYAKLATPEQVEAWHIINDD